MYYSAAEMTETQLSVEEKTASCDQIVPDQAPHSV